MPENQLPFNSQPVQLLLGSFRIAPLLLTSSMETVRQGKCLFVSLIFKALAFWAVFKARDRFSDVSSKQIALFSADTPSI